MANPFTSGMKGPYAVQMLNALWNRVTEQLASTSTSSLAISTGSKTLVTGVDKQFAVGQTLRITHTTNVQQWMEGIVSAYNPATGAMSFEVEVVNGSGTFTNWSLAIAGAQGPAGTGWSPVFAMANDGERRVFRITDWVGGNGAKPAINKYVSAAGLVDTAAAALDVRGTVGGVGPAGPPNALSIGDVQTLMPGATATANISGTAPNQQINLGLPRGLPGNDGTNGTNGTNGLPGTNGTNGTNGNDGLDAWTPVFAIVADGARRVVQITDWIGGEGSKPTTGLYLGATGQTAVLANAIDVRGPAGANGTGTGSVSPTGAIVANRIAVFDDTTGNVIKDGGKLLSDLATPAQISAAVAAQQLLTQQDLDALSDALGEKADSTDLNSKADLIGGKLDPTQLPALAITKTSTVASQAAMLALTAEEGDTAIRTDINKTFILGSGPSTTLGSWIELLFPAAVVSVAGKTGIVSLVVADVVGLQGVLDTLGLKVCTFASYAAMTATTGSLNAIYVVEDANKLYRWNGTGFTELPGADNYISDDAVPAGWQLATRAWTIGRTQNAIAAAVASVGSVIGDVKFSMKTLGDGWLPLLNTTLFSQTAQAALFAALDSYTYLDNPAATWAATTATVTSSGNAAIAFGNGVWVTINTSGLVRYGPNPHTAALTSGSTLGATTNMRFINGLFIRLGNATGTIHTSADGALWTSRTVTGMNGAINDVSYANGLYVLVGGNAANSNTQIYTSPDLVTWTNRTNPFTSSATLTGVRYNPVLGLFLACANTGTTRLATSPDGITWTSISVVASSYTGIAYGGGRWILTTSTNAYSIVDGATLSAAVSIGSTISDVYWIAGAKLFGIIASVSGSTTTLYTSTDGLVWTARSAGFGTSTVSGYIGSDGKKVIIMPSGASAMRWSTMATYDTATLFQIPAQATVYPVVAYMKVA